MLSRVLECFLERWNTFDRVGIPLYRVGMLSTSFEYLCTELECLRQVLNIFVQSWNAFDRVGMLSTELECVRQSWNTFVQG
jgi:hypothetical protein